MADIPDDRLWLVFFSDGVAPAWWARFLRPGFRHVTAACWYAGQERWVYYNPARRGTVIEVYRADEFGPRFADLMTTSAVVVRFSSRHAERRNASAWFFCVGAVKALLGVRSCALSVKGLHDHLLRHGGEIVHVEPVPQPTTSPAAGRPSARAPAAAGAATG